MIFATLGTHEQPMNRLTDALGLLSHRRPDLAPFVIQYGYSACPAGWSGHRMVGPDELDRLLVKAKVVIAHGGPATIAAARGAGKIPLVVPRDPNHGEHVDGHQLAYARRLAAAAEVVLIEEVAEIETAIDRLPTLIDALPPARQHDPRPAVELFGQYVDVLLKGP